MNALALHLALTRWEAMVIAARQTQTSHLPHTFQPRKHGSRLACDICGARKDDEIHTDRTPRPGR